VASQVKRIGHGGASAVVRGNTLASFDAALEIGVDMIEFDVRRHGCELLLAHTRWDARLGRCPSLDSTLAHLTQPRLRELELNLDIKSMGCEAAVVDALRRFGVVERSLVSSQLPAVVDRVRELDPAVRTGISIGGRISRGRQRWGDWRDAVLEAVRRRRFHAVMAYHVLIDAPLVAAIADAGGEIHAWTVDDRRAIDRLCGLGVDGIVTNDPRLFTPLPQPVSG
jgi:glycerophosphoryl diester phosphodiesterase